jgi:hypothetical protein
MGTRLCSIVLAGLAAVVLSACAVPRGGMPYHPRDDELVNDGTPAQREELTRRYKVSTDRWGVHVGEATRNRMRIEGPFPNEWAAVHPELAMYLSGDPEVKAALPNTYVAAVGTAAIVASGVMVVVAGLSVLAGVIFSAGFFVGAQPFRLPLLNSLSGPPYVAAGMGLSLGVGVAVALVALVLAVPLAGVGAAGQWWSWTQLDKAVELYNRNLNTRLEKNTKQPEVREVQTTR